MSIEEKSDMALLSRVKCVITHKSFDHFNIMKHNKNCIVKSSVAHQYIGNEIKKEHKKK